MIEILKFNRVIIHKVHPQKVRGKKQNVVIDSTTNHSNHVMVPDDETQIILKDRIHKSINQKTKFFKLSIVNTKDNSFYSLTKDLPQKKESEFIDATCELADILAESQSHWSIPGGLLLIMDGLTVNNVPFTVCIKAEIQDAFTLTNTNRLELIQQIFLTPAQELYKIGLIIAEKDNGEYIYPPNDKYSCYMYDDNFNLSKKDLTNYFYKSFLGCSTDFNGKIRTKLFYNETVAFITKYIKNAQDRKWRINAIKVLMREEESGEINPKEFAEKYFAGKIFNKYLEEVIEKNGFTTSFIKVTDLLDRSLKLDRFKMPLAYKLRLEGPQKSFENVELYEKRDEIQTVFNNGAENIEFMVVKTYGEKDDELNDTEEE